MTIERQNSKACLESYLIRPRVDDPALTSEYDAVDQYGRPLKVNLVDERALTLFLNNREIVTLMSIGDYPEWLAVGYLVNQNMICDRDVIEAVERDEELDVIVVRTQQTTDFEDRLKRKILTSGCGMGTVFGDMMDKLEGHHFAPADPFYAMWLPDVLEIIKQTPCLYRKAGSIHACVLCKEDKPLIYMEDVGRHNAMDKIAGYMFYQGWQGRDYYLYTTGRMTSEMVIKAVSMGISVLVSRSGATRWAVELAQKAGLTLISRAQGKRFIALSGQSRIDFSEDNVQKKMSVPSLQKKKK